MSLGSLPSDTELFLALKSGDVEALGELYDRYAASVYGMSLRVLASPDEAADLTQDVFLNLWNRSTYDPARGTFKSFLLLLTRSRAIDRLRTHGRQHKFRQRWQQADAHDLTAPPLEGLEGLSRSEQSQAMTEAMTQIPEAERQVLELAYFNGLSQSQIAQQLNIPLGTVKSRSRQGLLKLRRHLREFL